MEFETLQIERDGEVMTVTLNRPQKLNAVNDTMLKELTDLCASLRDDASTRFVIITGAGDAFSSGADLGSALENAEGKSDLPYEMARLQQLRGHEMMQRLEKLEQVTIAAINGLCLGAGFAIALACDFRVVAETAVFGLPETRVGVFFTWGCTSRLTKLIGPSRAKELIMTCDEVLPREALLWGLANRLSAPPDLLKAARAFADRIALHGPLAIRMTKKLVDAASLQGIGDTWLCEPELVERAFLSNEPIEGFNAFLEKRDPKFRDT
jgi:enoyl-CoA hydratase/carnithine racemase